MYKVIHKSSWTDSKGKVRNFYCVVRANSIAQAKSYAAQKWGLNNIEEVIEFTN